MVKMNGLKAGLMAAAALVALSGPASAQTQVAQSQVDQQQAKPAAEPAKVDDRYVWDLNTLYKTDADWDAERQAVLAEIPKLAALKGTLGTDAKTMAAALQQMSDVSKRVRRLSVYASTQTSTDTRAARNQERTNLMRALGGQLGAATAWLQPEILAIGPEKVEAFIKAEPALKNHATGLRDTLRLKAHTLSSDAEAALAAMGPVLGAASNTYNLLATADIPWPTLTVDGKEVKVNQIGYQRLREHADREVRRQAFDVFWKTFGQYENTFGSTLGSRIELGVTNAKLRGYPSAVAASLFDNAIPETVYRTLVAEVNKGLPTLHRYFRLRQRMLGLPDLHYYDIYPSLVELDRKYPIEEAKTLTLAAVRPLGDDYQAKLKSALDGRWMHVYPADGKRSGAYQTSVYEVHPFVFLNHQDNYDGVSTFAHEWGHGIHTKLANEAQPFETAGYSLFTAEIAAIVNEVLLSDHMLSQAETKEERLYYLGHALEQMRGTFFRQTMFAEFELATHDAVQRGEALSGKKMTAIYCDLLKRYHGHEQGVMKIDPAYCAEWAFIPHFYRPFYVYQYATSIAASAYFADEIEAKGAPARENYLKVLKAGGSVYPYELLKSAGLDMATPVPYQALIKRMDAIMDEMEQLLDSKK